MSLTQRLLYPPWMFDRVELPSKHWPTHEPRTPYNISKVLPGFGIWESSVDRKVECIC